MKTLSFTAMAIYPQEELTNRVYFWLQYFFICGKALIQKTFSCFVESLTFQEPVKSWYILEFIGTVSF